jgi:hypothetical protein
MAGTLAANRAKDFRPAFQLVRFHLKAAVAAPSFT